MGLVLSAGRIVVGGFRIRFRIGADDVDKSGATPHFELVVVQKVERHRFSN